MPRWVVVVVPTAVAATATSVAAKAMAFFAELLELPQSSVAWPFLFVEDAVGTVVLLLAFASRGLERLLVLWFRHEDGGDFAFPGRLLT